MTARHMLLFSNTTIAAVLGMISTALWLGFRSAMQDTYAAALGLFVLPAMLASALATCWVGWRGLERAAIRRQGAFVLALNTTLTGFGLFFVLVALVVWPATSLYLLADEVVLADMLAQGLVIAIVASLFCLGMGLLPAVALSWWASSHAIRRRRAELALAA